MLSVTVLPSVQCSATIKRTGLQCRRRAIAGGTLCAYHGAAPQVKAAAARRVARQELEGEVGRRLALQGDVSMPSLLDGLLAVVEHLARLVEVWRGIAAERDGLGRNRFAEDVVDPAAAEYRAALNDLGHMIGLALKAGIDERQVRMAEREAREWMEDIDAAVSAHVSGEVRHAIRMTLVDRLRKRELGRGESV